MSSQQLIYLNDEQLKDALEMDAKTFLSCMKMTHIVGDDYSTAVGVAFDIWHSGGAEVKAGTYLYWLAQEIGFPKVNKALETVLHNLMVIRKLDSNIINQFKLLLVSYGFTVESDMQGIVG